MICIIDKSHCCGCGACAEACPKHCITLKADEEGILYPSVQKNECVNCNLCDSVCPFKNVEKKEYNPTVVAAKALDSEIRFNSSSGGAFSVLAEYILSLDGLVCGAAMSDDCEAAQHVIIESKDELYKLRGSKYIPSNASNIYFQIKKYLENGRIILFSGVSCQIAGLKKYLRIAYSNLITVEIICHGVPSPELWVRYKRFWEQKYHKKINQVFFRNKKYGWNNYGNYIITYDKKTYFQFSAENPYFLMFNSGKALRPSCYDCVVKNGKCQADISLGDFWGISNFTNAFDDDKGVSLICINTDVGNSLFNKVSNRLFYVSDSLNIEKAAMYNPGVNRSIKKSPERERFYSDLFKFDFEDFMKKYASVPTKQRIKGFLLKIHIWSWVKRKK